jgi:hypothetical protein
MDRKLNVLLLAVAACGSGGNGPGGDDDQGASVTAVALPQALAGSMWADPDAYPTIPVHVAVTGTASAVSIALDGGSAVAATAAGSDWIAQLSIGSVADGAHALVATATGDDGTALTATANLAIGHAGIKWTDFATDSVSATPRLHAVGGKLIVTWSDVSSGTRVDWLQELDGAGSAVGDRVALLGGADQQDILYARTVFGASTLGAMYQWRGDPYVDWFTIVAPDGTQPFAPIALDPDGRVGGWGGDVAFDGTSYFVTWRTAAGPGMFDVRWMKIDEATGAVTGPIVVAVPGADDAADPHGSFDAISNVGVRALGSGASAVAFSRYEYTSSIDTDVLHCEYAILGGDGAITASVLGPTGSLMWSTECRVLDTTAGPIALWATRDLNSPDDNPPIALASAAFTAGALPDGRGNGNLMVTAPDQRSEPWIVSTAGPQLMAWIDDRNYDTIGRIQLMAAPLTEELAVTQPPTIFDHARFLEGEADVNGAPIGTNAMITWIDERAGGNVNNPTPEIYFETLWQ